MTILCFHNVAPMSSSLLTIALAEFESHCDWLTRNRTVVDLETATRGLDSRFRPSGRMSALTFDDGWSGVYDHAWPILRRHDLPFTIFVIAGTLIDPELPRDWVDNPEAAPKTMITLDQVRELQMAGVDIASHSMRHDDLRTLGPAACETDLRESRELLEDLLSAPVTTLAYPKGDHDATVRAAAERAGYAAAFALPEARETVSMYSIPRVGIYPGNTDRDLRIKTHRRYLDLRLHPMQKIAKSAKKRLGV